MIFQIRRRPDISGPCSGEPETLYIDPYPLGYTVTWSTETLVSGHPTPSIAIDTGDASAAFSIPVFGDDAPYIVRADLCPDE